MTKATQRPHPLDSQTVDSMVRLLAHQRGIPPAEAARELLEGLGAWFGIDFQREIDALTPYLPGFGEGEEVRS